MAASESIRVALDNLTDEVLTARLMCETFSQLVADKDRPRPSDRDPHGWVFVLSRAMERINQASEDLEALVRQKAIPLMADMEAVSKGGAGRAVASR